MKRVYERIEISSDKRQITERACSRARAARWTAERDAKPHLLGAAAHWASCSSSSVSSEPRFLLPNVLAVRRDDVGSKFPMLIGFLSFSCPARLRPLLGFFRCCFLSQQQAKRKTSLAKPHPNHDPNPRTNHHHQVGRCQQTYNNIQTSTFFFFYQK